MNFRNIKGTIMMVICGATALFAAAMLLYIIVVIFLKGVASLNPHFILFSEINTGLGLGTGVGNAVAGTILLAVSSTIIAIPFGIGTAIYLQKYATDNRFTRFLRLMIEVLSGTPSIVLGIFGVAVLVIYLKPLTGGESLIAGAISLGILIIPVIERSTEDALSRVSKDLEEGSYALGATKWLTIRDIIIPSAISGIIVGAILGFGRAAEESAVVLLTAGYSQYMPQFRIALNPNFLLGVKIYPLNDLVGSLPVFLYTSYENSNVFPVSSIFAAGFVLIVIVLFINLSAKAILFYVTAKTQGHQGDLLPSFCGSISDRFRGKQPKELPSSTDLTNPAPPDAKDTKKVDPVGAGASRPPRIPPLDLSWIDAGELIDASSSGETETPESVPAAAEPPKTTPKTTRITIRSVGTGFVRLITAIRENTRRIVHDTLQKKAPGHAAAVRGATDRAGALRKTQPFNIGTIIVSVRSFLITVAPFALVAVILMALTVMLPTLSPVGSNGPAGSLTVPIMALIVGMIGTVVALFMVRNSTLFLLRRRKGRIGNRRAEFAAIALGICVILVSAFIFSAHIFSSAPSIQSPGSEAPAENGIFSYFTPSGNGGISAIMSLIQDNGLLGFFHGSGSAATTSTASSNRSAQLAAFLASEETPAGVTIQSTPAASQPSPVPYSSAQAISSGPPSVPVKNALDLGESYWYGDNNRPCLATIYNVTVLPFYFYWDMDWNRFVQVTPVSSGDTFLVVFVRIEDTGNMSAIVPPATSFVVSYNGQTYSNEPYFDLSVLDTDEITYYTANFNAMPYQWIREIGQQKRDYAYLTGYNIFGQNQTVISNYTNSANAPPTPPDTNGQGYFIQPGRSNAIDGYLIYEVPDSVAADLRDTYVQVSFNSFSPTQWRLGK